MIAVGLTERRLAEVRGAPYGGALVARASRDAASREIDRLGLSALTSILLLGALCAPLVHAPRAPWARASLALARGGDARVEEPRAYRFQEEPVNGLGIARLEELRGKPVLVEFWGIACPSCVRGAVPAALKLQETFGDDLQVVLVESQGATSRQSEAFALGRRWLGGRAMWTSEAPLRVRGSTLPKFALLGNDGRVLLAGNPLDQPKEIERQIAEQIRDRKRPPADAPEALRPAWSAYLRGKVSEALALVDATIVDAERRSESSASARATRELFVQRYARELDRIERLCAAGLVEEALDALEGVAPAIEGVAELEKRRDELHANLTTAEACRERQLSSALGRLLARFHASGGEPAVAAELRAFAEHARGTKSAERALRAASLVAD